MEKMHREDSQKMVVEGSGVGIGEKGEGMKKYKLLVTK